MADDMPDTDATAPADDAPAPKRRVGRPPASKPDGAAKPARKPRTVKATIENAEEVVVEATKKPIAAVTGAARSTIKAVKPRAAKRTTPPTASKGKKSSARTGKGWGTVAIAGGLAAAGAAATAALLALRSSSPKPKPKLDAEPKGKAHQPDGTDASKSFDAGIADENTVPDKV